MHVLTPVYLINITTLINMSATLWLYYSPWKTSTFIDNWFIVMHRKRLRRWPLFISFIKVPSFCNVLSMLISSNVTQTQLCQHLHSLTMWHHLEMVDVVMRLCGLTKLTKRFCSFRRSFVFSIYCSRWPTTQISWSGYVKSTIGSRWCPGRDCFNNSGTKIGPLPSSNIIKSMFI